MSLIIDLAPEVEERLQQEATRRGVDAAEYARRLIVDGLPASLSDKQKFAITLLQSWIDEDNTDNPEEIKSAKVELKTFKQAMNENRLGERSLYP